MGPYEVLGTIGRGGMGTVHRARHQPTGQIVAVKIMNEEAAANDVLRRRFEQEYATSSRLAHPHLVRGYDFGEDGGRPYLVMEYVDGPNLQQRIKKQGPVPIESALAYFAQITSAVQFAHQHNLIHRDIKPENILLTRDGQAKLTDLGLTKDRNASINLTQAQSGLGTLVYAPPEQFDDARNADVRSDVYSLGASLYHALTGIPPFRGKLDMLTLGQKMRNDFVAPRKLVPTLPSGIDLAIRRALDADPEKRPANCEEWLYALGQFGTRAGDSAPVSIVDLDKEDLPQERRVAIRFPARLEAVCSPLRDSKSRWTAEVGDVSLTGIRLALNRRFEPGAMLSMELMDEHSIPLILLVAIVRWVRKQDDKRWWMGCKFHRALSETELNGLLGDLHDTVVLTAGS